jgi:hypothetical protein
MPVIRVSQRVYTSIIKEAGKRGCTISEAAEALFYTNLKQVDNPSTKVENGGEERYFSVKVNPETLTEVKNARRKDKGGLDTPAIGESGNGLEDKI